MIRDLHLPRMDDIPCNLNKKAANFSTDFDNCALAVTLIWISQKLRSRGFFCFFFRILSRSGSISMRGMLTEILDGGSALLLLIQITV